MNTALLTDNRTAIKNVKVIKVAPQLIDFSPLNYRKYYNQKDLENFAKEIKQHDIIAPLWVRITVPGRYELVVGERRLRASTIAALPVVPVIIKKLTDDEVREIQLAENLQREDPHPLHTAFAIGQLQYTGLKMDAIAQRLGKSKAFVLQHIKYLSLIDQFQQMFLAAKITAAQALKLSILAAAVQQEIFNDNCSAWQQKHFQFSNFNYIIDQYRCDLTTANFDIRDNQLLPDAGACTTCPFNSASLKLLFPDYAKRAFCSNPTCYQKKGTAVFRQMLASEIENSKPNALIVDRWFEENKMEAVEELNAGPQLPIHQRHEITLMEKPAPPQENDYLDEDDQIDQAAFEEAIEDYNTDLTEFELFTISGEAQQGLLINSNSAKSVNFIIGNRATVDNNLRTVTAKEVQEAIKNKMATPELLQAEIDRIQTKEIRSKELDAEKVQQDIYAQFVARIEEAKEQAVLTAEDNICATLIIYQALGYSAKYEVENYLQLQEDTPRQLYERLANLTPAEYSYLIRKVMAAKTEAKQPAHATGYFMYKNAAAAGIDVAAVEMRQELAAEKRQEKQAAKITDLQKKIGKLEGQTPELIITP